MAGSITVSSITLDSDNNFSIKSNTGATLFFANTTGIDVANSIGATAITNDKILSIANTKISGLVTASQIANVANTQLTGTLIASQIASVNATTATSGTLPTARLPAGSVLQVVSTTKSDTFSVTGGGTGSFFDITGFAVTITPTSATSKILVFINLSCSSSNDAEHLNARVVRGASTLVGSGDAIGSRNQAMWAHGITNTGNNAKVFAAQYLDSPATTSSTTYKVQGYNASSTFYLNRTKDWNDSNHYSQGASTITVMEIAA
jgi:hypothetical protein